MSIDKRHASDAADFWFARPAANRKRRHRAVTPSRRAWFSLLAHGVLAFCLFGTIVTALALFVPGH